MIRLYAVLLASLTLPLSAFPAFARPDSLSSLTITPTTVTAGGSATGTATLARTAPSTGALVALTSSNAAVVAVPPSVTVPAGALSATFAATTYSVTASTTVTVTGTYGGVSRSATLTVTPAPLPPATPTGLTAVAGNAQVALSWNASSGATGYQVMRAGSSAGPFNSSTVLATTTSTSYSDVSVVNGTTYYYAVAATNSAGTSASSAPVAATPSAASAPVPDLGVNANMNGYRPFPSDNPWNTPIDTQPVDPNSATLIQSIGLTTGLHTDFGSGAGWTGVPFGIPYDVVSGTQALVPVSFTYASESDPGPYPIPPDAPIEGGSSSTGDRHVLIVDRDHLKLYEMYNAFPQTNGSWTADSGALFDMTSDALRPAGWTSADAAGLPIFPGLVRYDEVQAGAIHHALRFTVQSSRAAYVYPARHFASINTSASLPPMGMRVRLKASFDISSYPPEAQVILQAMKKYGMFVADNGSNWYFSGTPDARWDDTQLSTLKQVTGSSFEVVQMGALTTN